MEAAARNAQRLGERRAAPRRLGRSPGGSTAAPLNCQRGSSISTVIAPYDHTMSTPEVELRSAWQHARRAHGHAATSLDGLLARHREPHRRYHTATHVMWVLRHIDHIAAAGSNPPTDLAAVRLAALCHDAVYDPRRRRQRGAQRRPGRSGGDRARLVDRPRRHRGQRLVLATAGHRPARRRRGDVGRRRPRHPRRRRPATTPPTCTGVRSEYAHVADDAVADRPGRGAAAVPRRSRTLFHTAIMHARTRVARHEPTSPPSWLRWR